MSHVISRSTASRRQIVKGALGIGLAAALPGIAPAFAQTGPAAAAQDGIIRRTIGRTNEAIPAIGLGTFLTFDVLPGQKRDHLREVIRAYWEGGARVVDTSPLYGTGENSVGDFATDLGIADQLFISNKIWATGEFLADESHARRSLEQSQLRLWRDRIDLLQCHSLVNVDFVVPLLNAWKKEGLVRYAGDHAFREPLSSDPHATGSRRRRSMWCRSITRSSTAPRRNASCRWRRIAE